MENNQNELLNRWCENAMIEGKRNETGEKEKKRNGKTRRQNEKMSGKYYL